MESRIPTSLFLTPYLQIYIISLNRLVYISVHFMESRILIGLILKQPKYLIIGPH